MKKTKCNTCIWVSSCKDKSSDCDKYIGQVKIREDNRNERNNRQVQYS